MTSRTGHMRIFWPVTDSPRSCVLQKVLDRMEMMLCKGTKQHQCQSAVLVCAFQKPSNRFLIRDNVLGLIIKGTYGVRDPERKTNRLWHLEPRTDSLSQHLRGETSRSEWELIDMNPSTLRRSAPLCSPRYTLALALMAELEE